MDVMGYFSIVVAHGCRRPTNKVIVAIVVYFTFLGDLQPTYTGPKDPITFSNDGLGV